MSAYRCYVCGFADQDAAAFKAHRCFGEPQHAITPAERAVVDAAITLRQYWRDSQSIGSLDFGERLHQDALDHAVAALRKERGEA